jgi:hypothetical protein
VAPLPGSPLQYLSTLAAAGDPADLIGHFVLGAPPPLVPAGWNSQTLGRWTVAADPALPIRALTDAQGTQLGWILGHPLIPGSTAPSPATFTVDLGADPVDVGAVLDEQLGHLAGRWIALAVELATVVPDSDATLPAVFDAERGLVSSSPFLLQSADEPVPDHPLAAVVRTFDTGLWFLFDTTPHLRARRLMGSHTLDLKTWEQTRRWPKTRFAATDPEEATESVIDALQQVMIAAVADAGPLNCALTAGGDTREILAASRAFVDRLHYFAIAIPDFIGRRDVRISESLAKRFGLDHRTLQWVPAAQNDVKLFMYRTGAQVGERRGRIAGPTYAQLGSDRPYVAGVNAAVGNVWRDLGWRTTDTETTPLGPDDILERYFAPPDALVLERASAWLDGVAGFDTIEKLSLLSVELRLGNWGGALTTAYPDAYTYSLYPFAWRPIKEAIFGVAYSYRTSGHIREDIVRRRWPELLEVPVNPLTLGYRLASRTQQISMLASAAAARARRVLVQ